MRLETERLVLREFQVADAGAIHEYASDPEVAQYMDWGPNTPEETEAVLQMRLRQQEAPDLSDPYSLAVVLKETGKLIGVVSLYDIDPVNRSAGVGYCLNRAFWGQGYATEAVRAMLQFGFEELHLHRIYGTCRPENIGSWRVMEKVGMRREGHLREDRWMKGRWQDSLLYAILEPGAE